MKLNSFIWHTIILISYIPLSVTVLTYSITINFYPSAATSVVLSHIKGYWRLTSHIALHYISFWAPHSALFYQMTLTLKVSFILWNTTILLLISSIYFGINYTWILALSIYQLLNLLRYDINPSTVIFDVLQYVPSEQPYSNVYHLNLVKWYYRLVKKKLIHNRIGQTIEKVEVIGM